jgi:hypothetical protein
MAYLLILLIIFIFANSGIVPLDANAKNIVNLVLLVLLVLCLLLFVSGLPYWRMHT